MKKIPLLLLFLLFSLAGQARTRIQFDADWLFVLGDDSTMASPSYDDRGWRRLSLPHDWAIEGDFHVGNPSGASGGALPGGVGWYRKHFRLPAGSSDDRVLVSFDGVYMNATVYVNGHALGTRPYGYSTFEYDLTPYLDRSGENVLAVRVDNSDQPNSRWYSGCGIYRHVWLTTASPLRVAQWGVHAVAQWRKGDTWEVRVDVALHNDGPKAPQAKVRHQLLDPNGRVVARHEGRCQGQVLTVRKPLLWDIYQGHVYQVVTEVVVGGKVVDRVSTPTAFRTFRFYAETGFWLNGRNVKINGVCEHHDFGALGAALDEDALHRKLTRLKAMGVNAVRSSHNPPAPELLAMCDTMGLVVMDESFDMWRRRKTKNDYARFFDQWHERDLSDLVLRDRNHP